MPPRRRRFHIPWWVSSVVFAVILALLLHQFVFQSFSIPSGSMEPTLMVNDRVLVDKLAYDLHSVHRGDIIVFHAPPKEDCGDTGVKYLVKRVIGLPGQTISSSPSGQVLINGQPISERYLPDPDPLGRAIPKTVIPKGDYYMLGDNRDDSCDSRYWGLLKGSLIVGKVDARTWPLSRIHWF